ncbi:hypothetical protein IFR05_014204 [Cadophora sp. M221]|nr:hypothetical protein IFR05_014204 [Cadophora sp. M221]
MSITILKLLLFSILIAPATSINRDQCANEIWALINNKTLNPNDGSKFWDQPVPNTPLSITNEFCNSQCGEKFSWYPNNEIASRLVVWLIPVLVLMGNLHMPSLSAKYKLFSLLHMLGDPVDTLLSLQHTLAIRHAAYIWAQRTITQLDLQVQPDDLATVSWALDTLDAGGSAETVLIPVLHRPTFPFALQEAASDIRAATVKEPTRTFLAIAIYLSTVTSAFIKASSDNQALSRPGNRIAFAMLYSWLIPVILLSSFGNRFTTSDACIRAIRRFSRHLDLEETELLPKQFSSKIIGYGIYHTSDPQKAAPWAGAIYVFRPRKAIFWQNVPHFPSPLYLLLCALAPIAIAVVTAVLISYNTPTKGIGCRSITHLSITTMWLLSFLITTTLQKTGLATGKWLLVIVAIKDAVIGLGSLCTVILIFAGRFNSCWCWSNGLNGVLGHSLHILLGATHLLQANAESIYPGLVGAGLGAQALAFLLMWGGGWAGNRWWGLLHFRPKGSNTANKWFRSENNRRDSEIPLVKESDAQSTHS